MNKKSKQKHRMSVIHLHDFSPMARGTRTPSRQEKQRRKDRRQKQKGWRDV